MCGICKKPIDASSQSLECPYCINKFHRDHLLEWIKTRGKCPNCGKRLTRDNLGKI
ncbi:MAG: hypothetical protein GF329_06740 [Candidatus Lokiarchaeota archaeon]|nr:hypothetical protein [Candidatus Lokiarchaeota archaeon]